MTATLLLSQSTRTMTLICECGANVLMQGPIEARGPKRMRQRKVVTHRLREPIQIRASRVNEAETLNHLSHTFCRR